MGKEKNEQDERWKREGRPKFDGKAGRRGRRDLD